MFFKKNLSCPRPIVRNLSFIPLIRTQSQTVYFVSHLIMNRHDGFEDGSSDDGHLNEFLSSPRMLQAQTAAEITASNSGLDPHPSLSYPPQSFLRNDLNRDLLGRIARPVSATAHPGNYYSAGH